MPVHAINFSENPSLVAQAAYSDADSTSFIHGKTFLATMNTKHFGNADQPIYERLLGEGSFGQVFLGKFKGQPVAIKTERLDAPRRKRVLAHEATMLSHLQDGVGIPKLFGSGQGKSVQWMATQLFHTDLERYRVEKGGTLRVTHVAIIGVYLFSVLEYLYQKKVVHLDIKPENLMLDDQGYLYMIDFGLAQMHEDSVQNDTIGGSVKGTPRFMSKQTMRGCRQTYRDDALSVLYTLIYLAVGRLPWQGLHPNPESGEDEMVALKRAVLKKKESTSIRELCDTLPREFKEPDLTDDCRKIFYHCSKLPYGKPPKYKAIKSLLGHWIPSIAK